MGFLAKFIPHGDSILSAVSGRRLQWDQGRQALFRQVSGQIQHQLDHPRLGVHDTGLAGGERVEPRAIMRAFEQLECGVAKGGFWGAKGV